MISWTPRFETGHTLVDAEHREMIDQLNALDTALAAGAGREKVVEMIGLLQRYALGHFCREEAHMRHVGCPAFVENCVAHGRFLRTMEGWLTLLATPGASTSVLVDVHREASAWVQAHIVSVDCKLRHCQAA